MPWQSQAFLFEEGVARSVTEGVNAISLYAQPYSLSFACAQQRLACRLHAQSRSYVTCEEPKAGWQSLLWRTAQGKTTRNLFFGEISLF